MYSITDLKIGTLIELGAEPFEVLEFQHKKIARGGATVQTKLKNLITGATLRQTFKGSEQIIPCEIFRTKVQFLYKDKKKYFFMDSKTFEQFEMSEDVLGMSKNFLKEGSALEISFFKERPIKVILPIKMDFKVTNTEPGIKGNTVQGGTKPAEIETGFSVLVPLFIKNGDKILVDTRTGTYCERSKQQGS